MNGNTSYSGAAGDVIYLAGCAICDRAPDPGRVAGMDLDAVYAFAKRHTIAAAAAFALERAGCRDDRFASAIAAAMRKTACFDNAWAEIKGALEAAGIWYMPLKGAVLKGMYPKYGMREFADHDILFDAVRAEDVKRIMEGLGFTTESFGAIHHDTYHKPPIYNFEMHTALFDPDSEKLYEYYKDVGGRLLGPGCEKHFSPEDFYLYLLAHEYKHYQGSGTGLRSLMDTYVYLNRQPMDMDYVVAEAEKLGLRAFEAANRSLALNLFGGGELTAADREMLDYIQSSGTYGTIGHRVQNQMRKNRWTRLQYMLDRFFVPVSKKNRNYAAYAAMYPFFYRYKLLLPVLPFYRTFRAIRSGRFRTEARAIRDAKK